MLEEPRTSARVFSNRRGDRYCASRTLCESVKAIEIDIAPKMTIRFMRFVFARSNGNETAASIDAPIETSVSQRQGNCVSCKGENTLQIGRLNGSDINTANAVRIIAGRASRRRGAASRRKRSNNTGAQSSRVMRVRMFIHQTFMFSGDNVDSRKLCR